MVQADRKITVPDYLKTQEQEKVVSPNNLTVPAFLMIQGKLNPI